MNQQPITRCFEILIHTTLRTKKFLKWVRIPFLGKQGKYLVKKFIGKIQCNVTKPVKFIVIYQTKKVVYFLSKKDNIPDLERSDV